MRKLASHYHHIRAKYPRDRLLILFDVDGTIVDLRYMTLRLLRRYDHERGTAHFAGLSVDSIDVSENRIETLLDGVASLDDRRRADVSAWRGKRFWEREAMLQSHRPFSGVMEVMRWFQMQPRADVGINTARPEWMREDTLRSLNALGREFKTRFDSRMVFMSPYEWDARIEDAKREGVRRFREMGYRVFAFVDNEPANLEAVAGMEGADEILLLHADTLFETARSRLPSGAVSGSAYDLAELASADSIPKRVQFVWRGADDRDGIAKFIESGVQWLEVAVRSDPATGELALAPDPIDESEPPRLLYLREALDAVERSGRSLKLDIRENGATLDRLVETLGARRFPMERLWFNANADTLRERGFRRLRARCPKATIQCPADFMAPLILSMPDRARGILAELAGWGIDRFSVKWDNPERRRAIGALQGWGYGVNICNVPNLEAFLKAALLSPTSLTADFDSPAWRPVGADADAAPFAAADSAKPPPSASAAAPIAERVGFPA